MLYQSGTVVCSPSTPLGTPVRGSFITRHARPYLQPGDPGTCGRSQRARPEHLWVLTFFVKRLRYQETCPAGMDRGVRGGSESGSAGAPRSRGGGRSSREVHEAQLSHLPPNPSSVSPPGPKNKTRGGEAECKHLGRAAGRPQPAIFQVSPRRPCPPCLAPRRPPRASQLPRLLPALKPRSSDFPGPPGPPTPGRP